MATLEQLREARDALLTGQRIVSTTSGGRSVSYAAADLADIERRIRALEAETAKPVTLINIRPRKGWS